MSGHSHNTIELTQSMVEYFTMQRTKALLRYCEAHGINAFQSRADRWIFHILKEHRQEGGNLKFICQTASVMKDIPGNIRIAAREGDCGVAVGVGSHKPEVIEYYRREGLGR